MNDRDTVAGAGLVLCWDSKNPQQTIQLRTLRGDAVLLKLKLPAGGELQFDLADPSSVRCLSNDGKIFRLLGLNENGHPLIDEVIAAAPCGEQQNPAPEATGNSAPPNPVEDSLYWSGSDRA